MKKRYSKLAILCLALLLMVMNLNLSGISIIAADDTSKNTMTMKDHGVKIADGTTPVSFDAGQVWVDKQIKDNEDGSFTITLTAQGLAFEDNGKTSNPLKNKTNLIVKDSIGNGFALDGKLKDKNASIKNDVLTWKIPASKVTSKNGKPIMNSISYTVKYDAAAAGTYYTNLKADVAYTPVDHNPYYYDVKKLDKKTKQPSPKAAFTWNKKKGYVKSQLLNRGYVTLEAKTTPTAKKAVTAANKLSLLKDTGELDVNLNKTAKQTSDDRTFQVQLDATSKTIVESEQKTYDIVMLIDLSASMKNKIKVLNSDKDTAAQTKIAAINDTIGDFITNLKEKSPESRVAIISYAGYYGGNQDYSKGDYLKDETKGFVTVKDYNYTELSAKDFNTDMSQAMRMAYLNYYNYDSSKRNPTIIANKNGENASQELKETTEAKNLNRLPDENHEQILVALTDGHNTAGSKTSVVGMPSINTANMGGAEANGNTDNQPAMRYATYFKEKRINVNKKNVQIWSLGFGVPESESDAIPFLKYIASPDPDTTEEEDKTKYFSNPGTTEALKTKFNELLEEITKGHDIEHATIKDTITKEFKISETEKKRLEKTGAKITEDANGTTVTWENQTVKYKANDTPGWSQVINVEAREDFLGGNYVATNTPDNAVISADGASKTFPQKPTVNVGLLPMTIDNNEVTLYLNDPVEVNQYIAELNGSLNIDTVKLSKTDLDKLMKEGKLESEYSYNNTKYGTLEYKLEAIDKNGDPIKAEEHVAGTLSDKNSSGSLIPVETYKLTATYKAFDKTEREKVMSGYVASTNDEVKQESAVGTYVVKVKKVIDADLHKTLSQAENDRTFTIHLDASSTEMPEPMNIFLVIDITNNNTYVTMNNLNNGIRNLIQEVKKVSANSTITILSTYGTSYKFIAKYQTISSYNFSNLSTMNNNTVNIGSAMESLYKNTYLGTGGEKPNNYKDVMITYTSKQNIAAPTSAISPVSGLSVKDTKNGYDKVPLQYAKYFKDTKNVDIYSMGLTSNITDNTTKTRYINFLNTLASGEDHVYTTTYDELTDKWIKATGVIAQEIAIENAIISDTITDEFQLATGEKQRLEADDAIVDYNDLKGTTTITWNNQTVKSDWNKTIKIVAKDAYLGGNYVATNTKENATITVDGRKQAFPERPTANVGLLPINMENFVTTLYIGDQIEASAYLKELNNSISIPSLQLSEDELNTLMKNTNGSIQKDYIYNNTNYGKLTYKLTPTLIEDYEADQASKKDNKGNLLPVVTYTLSVSYDAMKLTDRKAQMKDYVDPPKGNTEVSKKDGIGKYEVFVDGGPNVILNKTARQTDNEKREFEITLEAGTNGTSNIVSTDIYDIVILVDLSASMKKTILDKTPSGKETSRYDDTKAAIESFIDNLKNKSPNSRVAIISYGGDPRNGNSNHLKDETDGFKIVKDNTFDITDIKWIDEQNTNMSQAMKMAYENYYFAESDSHKPDETHKQILVAFTDGENNTGSGISVPTYLPGERQDENHLFTGQELTSDENKTKYGADNIPAMRYAAYLKQYKDVELFSIGYGVKTDTKGAAFLSYIATKDGTGSDCIKHYSNPGTVEELNSVFDKLFEDKGMLHDLEGVTIKDTITKEFKITDEEKQRLINDGAILIPNLDGTTTVMWMNQTIKYKADGSATWNKKINIVAKDDYLGGNYVPTNTDATLQYTDHFTYHFPKPTVNVGLLPIIIQNDQILLFKGETVNPNEYLYTLGETINLESLHLTKDQITELNEKGSLSVPYDYHVSENADKADKDAHTFGTLIYTITPINKAEHEADTESEIDRITKNRRPAETYTLQVKYTALTMNDRENLLPEGYKDPSNENVTNIKSNVGKYDVYVMPGELDITKKINQQYTDEKIINANQSFVFRVDRVDPETNQILDTFYQTIAFSANETKTVKTVKIKGLEKGYYTITEIKDWSWKYDLQSQSDNYEKKAKENQKIYIGDIKDDGNYFGVEDSFRYNNKEYGNPAASDFVNVLNTMQIPSDVASAINKFTNEAPR